MACRFPKCKTSRTHCWGLCNRHRKWVERGYFDKNLNPLKPLDLKPRRTGCKLGCDAKHKGLGFCQRHYRQYKEGSIDIDGERLKLLIRYPKDFGCIRCGKRGRIIKGLCKHHYAQMCRGLIGADGTPIRPPKRVRSYRGAYCRGCKKARPRIRGYCELCHAKIKRGTMSPAGILLCAKKSCSVPRTAGLFCPTHSEQPKTVTRKYINKGNACPIIACKRPASHRGLCHTHYNRRRRRLKTQTSTAHPAQDVPHPQSLDASSNTPTLGQSSARAASSASVRTPDISDETSC